MTPEQLLNKWPVKNPAWNFSPEHMTFAIEASELRNRLDPWNRQLPIGFRDIYQGDEVAGWEYQTTMGGQPIKMVVFND